MDITVVTLDNPYESIKNPEAKHLFSELVNLRHEGYGSNYPKSFLPLDTADYFIWHHLFCFKNEGRLIPFAGFRKVSLKRCDFYKVQFPLLKTAVDANAERHTEVLENIMSKHRKEETELVYSAGLTINKSVRRDLKIPKDKWLEHSKTMRELVGGLTYGDMIERNVKAYVGAAVLRFSTQKWFPDMGYKWLSYNGEELPPIKKIAAEGEPMMLMHMEEAGPWAKECYFKHKNLLDHRTFITPETVKTGEPKLKLVA